MRAACRRTCSSSSTTTRCRSPKASARCRSISAACWRAASIRTLREGGKKVLSQMPTMRELARRSEEHMKGMVLPGTMFEEMGFNYIGPIDGHDMKALVGTLRNIRELKGPQFLHVVTTQGQGLCARRGRSHHVARTRPVRSGQRHHLQGKGAHPTYSRIFGDWLCDMADARSAIVGITPAMREGSGLVRILEALSGALLRRGDCRAACRDFRRGPRDRRHQARASRSTPPSCSAATTS